MGQCLLNISIKKSLMDTVHLLQHPYTFTVGSPYTQCNKKHCNKIQTTIKKAYNICLLNISVKKMTAGKSTIIRATKNFALITIFNAASRSNYLSNIRSNWQQFGKQKEDWWHQGGGEGVTEHFNSIFVAVAAGALSCKVI
jgi:hypothetical protein